MIWHINPPFTFEHLGLIPTFLSEGDTRSAREQLDGNYAHGGGWNAFEGLALNTTASQYDWQLEYPGDRPMRLLGYTGLRDEVIAVFEYAWIAIVASDGSYEIARMD